MTQLGFQTELLFLFGNETKALYHDITQSWPSKWKKIGSAKKLILNLGI